MTTIRRAKPYRILSLDGGGTWALIQAKVLMDLYPKCSGHQILQDFDLVAANSGGGIVVAGLIADMAPADILSFFRDEKRRTSLFQKLPFYRRLWRLLHFGPRFSTKGKLEGLSAVLGGLTTNALQALRILNRNGEPVRFLFTAYDYDRDRAVYFRSDSNSPTANFPKSTSPLSVIQAVHASSTAPVQFFDEPAMLGDRRYWDGGVAGLNNPVLAAVVEAIGYGISREKIGVLTIGTGNTFLPVGGATSSSELLQQRIKQGLFTDTKKMAKAVLADPPDADSFIAYVMLGGNLPTAPNPLPTAPSAMVRMNPLIRPTVLNGQWMCPSGFSSEDFKKLAEMDLAVIDANDLLLVEQFCNGWMADQWPNQPIRHGSDLVDGVPNTAFCEIGHAVYSAARGAW